MFNLVTFRSDPVYGLTRLAEASTNLTSRDQSNFAYSADPKVERIEQDESRVKPTTVVCKSALADVAVDGRS
jgi:hypothetical protein